MNAEDSMYGAMAAEAAVSNQVDTIHEDWLATDIRYLLFKCEMAKRAAEKVA